MKNLLFISFVAMLFMAVMPVEKTLAFDLGQSSEFVITDDLSSVNGDVVFNLDAISVGWEAAFVRDNCGIGEVDYSFSNSLVPISEPDQYYAYDSYPETYDLVDIGNSRQCNYSGFLGIGGNGDESSGTSGIINIILLLVTSVFAGLWTKVKTKLTQLSELLNVLIKYMDDDRLSTTEAKDIVNRVKVLLGKNSDAKD